ncbi:MAG: ShlB/FhaC/HecB family hemolysin secretion/activation protein [Pseudomonadota bacterium]
MKHAANQLLTLTALLAALLAFSPLAAQAAGTAAPDAGSILQQIQPVTPHAPSSSETGLMIEQQDGDKLPPSAPFVVTMINISGNILFNTQLLHALVKDGEGQSLTLPQLGELAARITDYYQSQGYPLSRAFIPAQTIQSGIVRIQIIEASYGKIKLENRSRVNDKLLKDTILPLQSGQPIAQTELNHSLLLLSDIPGATVNATLKPGDAVGTSDLLVQAMPGPLAWGNVVLDGYGNRYTGRARIGGAMYFNNPLRHGDYLSLNVLTSGSGMNYARVSYESLLNGKGTRTGGAYSALHYILGDTLTPLNGHGTAQVESLWIKHPITRTPDANVYGQIQYDHKQLADHIDVSSTQADRHLDNWTMSFSGDQRDRFMSGAINNWSLGLTSGRLGFDDIAAQAADAATAQIQNGFSKWNASLARLQSLGSRNTLYIAFSGQAANTNLDSSEKMTAGGPYTVRAYDMGAISGDGGYILNIEFRRDLGMTWHGQWQAVAFVDNAHVAVNRNVWVAGINSATVSGAGVGINWTGTKQWNAKAYIATPIGSTPVLVASTSSARAWIEVSKGF